MALQSSGQITINNIVTEFGGAAPHNLTEYYRGGAYVPDGPAGNASIPTSGQISLTNFYGGVAQTTITVTQGTQSVGGAALNGYCQTNKCPTNVPPTDNFITAPTSTIGSRNPTTVSGATLQGAAHHVSTKTSNDRFFVTLSGTRAQTFITTVQFQSKGVFTTASANFFFQSASSTCWVWDNQSIGSWDGTGNLTVIFTQGNTMFIESIPTINAINKDKAVMSVTYTAVDTALGLEPYHIQQLGIEKQIILDYASGALTKPEVKELLWQACADASGEPSFHWNQILETEAVTIPADIDEDVGIPLRAITTADVSGNANVIEVI